MTRVLVLATGGTISSLPQSEAEGGFVPELDGATLIGSVPGLEDVAGVEVETLATLSSTALDPEQVFGWARYVERRMADAEIAGVVVTHGTDSLEESAYLFDLALDIEKPVVFTGAMRTQAELMSDGPRNIHCSVHVAASEEARGLGVLVVLNEEIHAARDVTKAHAEGLHAFASPALGPVGVVSRGWGADHVTVYRQRNVTDHIPAQRIEPRVAYFKSVLGSDSDGIIAAVDGGARGIVIEGFAGGEIAVGMAEGVEYARERRIPIVVACRALAGRPNDLYATVGEGRWLRERGVFLSDNIGGPKARIRLMLALGLPERDRDEVLSRAH